MEIDKEQIDELKKVLEPRQLFEAGTELPTQHFLDTDVLALGVFHKELLNYTIKYILTDNTVV